MMMVMMVMMMMMVMMVMMMMMVMTGWWWWWWRWWWWWWWSWRWWWWWWKLKIFYFLLKVLGQQESSEAPIQWIVNREFKSLTNSEDFPELQDKSFDPIEKLVKTENKIPGRWSTCLTRTRRARLTSMSLEDCSPTSSSGRPCLRTLTGTGEDFDESIDADMLVLVIS